MKALIFTISILVIIPYSIFAIDKEEALYYNNWNDSLQDNNLILSKAYINSNPSKALAYISQAIINTDNVLLKAKCYLQKGIIYNYSYANKGKAALENYLLAKEIYAQNSIQNKLIITNILIGEAHINLGEQNKASNLFWVENGKFMDRLSSFKYINCSTMSKRIKSLIFQQYI